MKYIPESNKLKDWDNPDIIHELKNRFVTGDWKENIEDIPSENEDLENDNLEEDELKDDDDDIDESKLLEKNDDDDIELDNETESKPLTLEEERKKNLEDKAKQKEDFDKKYDFSRHYLEEDEEYYNEQKKLGELQEELNKEEFKDLTEEERIQIQGYIPGTYVRIEISHVPCEFVLYFNPYDPILLGGVLTGETKLGLMRVFY